MRVLVAVTALAALAQAKVYVFNGANCNTNFDNAANWQNYDNAKEVSTPVIEKGKSTYPSVVEFADGTDQSVPVDAYIPPSAKSVGESTGGFRAGTVKLQNNMKLTFSDDSAAIFFDKGANGGTASFASGQTSGKGACSLGCHSNFFVAKTNKVEDVVEYKRVIEEANGEGFDIEESSKLAAATDTPCGDDTVVLPAGYGFNFLALGFHAYKSVVYKTGDGEGNTIVESTNAAELPDFMTWPSMQQKVFVGKDVIDDCEAYGHKGTKGSKQVCICTTECPADQQSATDQASALRAASKKHAVSRLADMTSPGDITSKKSFSFEFAHAYNGEDVLGCSVNGDDVAKNVAKYFNDAVSTSAIDVEFTPGNRFTVKGSVKNTPDEWVNSFALGFDGAIVAQDSITAPTYQQCDADEVAALKDLAGTDACKAVFDGTLNANSGKDFGGETTCDCLAGLKDLDSFGRIDGDAARCSIGGGAVVEVVAACAAKKNAAPSAVVDVKADSSATLAMQVYHAVVTQMKSSKCISDAESKKLVAGAGITLANDVVNVFGGANLPQMDVYRFTDGGKKGKEGVIAHLIEGLSQVKTGFQSWEKGAINTQSFVITSPGERVHGKESDGAKATTPEAHVDARYGHATQLVKVVFDYQGWVTGAGPQTAPLEAAVNSLLATYELQSHHKCFEFATGYSQECINGVVYDAIEKDLDREECSFGKYDECQEQATQIAYDGIIAIKRCGILGTYNHKTADGVEARCADPKEEARVRAEAAKLANETASMQVASLMTAHSSSMFAYSSSKEAVRVDLQTRYDDMLKARETAKATMLAKLSEDIADAEKDAKSDFDRLAGDAVNGWNPKGGDAGVDATMATKLKKLKSAAIEAQDTYDVELKAFQDCNETAFNYTSDFEDPEYCQEEYEGLMAAVEDGWLTSAKYSKTLAEYAKYLGDHAKDNGISTEDREIFKGFLKDLGVQCDASTKYAELAADWVAANDDKDLKDFSKAYSGKKDEYCGAKATAETQESAAGEPPEDDNMMMIIIIAAGAVVVILICVAAVMLVGGGSNQKDDSDRNVVAFENPMYDDPNQQAYDASGGYGASDGYGAPPPQVDNYGAPPRCRRWPVRRA